MDFLLISTYIIAAVIFCAPIILIYLFVKNLHVHKWKYIGTFAKQKRICEKCKEVQIQNYDMSYGETYWITIDKGNLNENF